jgi:hypothetical protein
VRNSPEQLFFGTVLIVLARAYNAIKIEIVSIFAMPEGQIFR